MEDFPAILDWKPDEKVVARGPKQVYNTYLSKRVNTFPFGHRNTLKPNDQHGPKYGQIPGLIKGKSQMALLPSSITKNKTKIIEQPKDQFRASS